MQGQWRRLRGEFGLSLPMLESEHDLGGEVVELRQQVMVARFVSEAMGRGAAKAEMEQVMEDEMESKNFEIARLIDRLHYYEAVNREMSQRNQEAVGESVSPSHHAPLTYLTIVFSFD